MIRNNTLATNENSHWKCVQPEFFYIIEQHQRRLWPTTPSHLEMPHDLVVPKLMLSFAASCQPFVWAMMSVEQYAMHLSNTRFCEEFLDMLLAKAQLLNTTNPVVLLSDIHNGGHGWWKQARKSNCVQQRPCCTWALRPSVQRTILPMGDKNQLNISSNMMYRQVFLVYKLTWCMSC